MDFQDPRIHRLALLFSQPREMLRQARELRLEAMEINAPNTRAMTFHEIDSFIFMALWEMEMWEDALACARRMTETLAVVSSVHPYVKLGVAAGLTASLWRCDLHDEAIEALHQLHNTRTRKLIRAGSIDKVIFLLRDEETVGKLFKLYWRSRAQVR